MSDMACRSAVLMLLVRECTWDTAYRSEAAQAYRSGTEYMSAGLPLKQAWALVQAERQLDMAYRSGTACTSVEVLRCLTDSD